MAELVSSRLQDLSIQTQISPDSMNHSNDDASLSSQEHAFNFPIHVESFPNQSQSKTTQDSPHRSAPAASFHKRSRTSVNKLPAFSFNPGATGNSADAEEHQPRVPSVPTPPESPSKGRHRRSSSELVGGHVGLKTSSSSPIKVDHIGSVDGQLHTFGHAPAHRGHGHRRPEARSSQDLSPPLSQFKPTSDEPSAVRSNGGTHRTSAPSTPPFETPENLPIQTMDLALSPSDDPSDLHDRTGLDTELTGNLPRQMSKTSDESGRSLSTLRDIPVSGNAAFVANYVARDGQNLEVPTTSSKHQGEMQNSRNNHEGFQNGTWDQRNGFDSSNLTYPHLQDQTAVQLDENFDHDPTSTITLDNDSQTDHSVADKIPLSSLKSSSMVDANETGIIDLDLALTDLDTSQDQRSPHVRSFQSARRSMHSSALMSGFMGQGMHFHRRTESAPSPATINFDRHLDGSASEMGFGMDNVFEEDEEDAHQATTIVRSAQNVPRRGVDGHGLGIKATDRDETAFESHRMQSGPLTNDYYSNSDHADSAGNSVPSQNDLQETGYALTPPQAPFMTPDGPSSRSPSSLTGAGSSEHSVQFRQSADDVPSLVSGSSTVASGVPSHHVAGSPRGAPPGSSGSTSTLARPDERRRKRASVVSLSRLIGGSYSEDRQVARAGLFDKRCQSSDGIAPPKKAGQHRLSRLLKFWKGKGDGGS